jgi:DNA-binding response OmpR family regulator
MDTPHRIGLVDDDRTWLETLSDYLEAKGFEVRTAQGALRGFDLLADENLHLAVVDFRMPDMDGLELLRRLRRRRGNLAALLLSSEEDPRLAARAVAEGAIGFLSKTAPPALLMRRLVQTLGWLAFQPASHLGHERLRERLLPVPRLGRIWLPARLPDDGTADS